jgi:hypothetical protein
MTDTNSISISNPHSEGASAGLPGARINVARWVHLRHCGKLDPLAPFMKVVSDGCTSRCSSITPYMKYYALSCVPSTLNCVLPSNNSAGTAEPGACAVVQTCGATGRCVSPTVVHNEPRSFDVVSDTNSISISSPHSKGVLGGLPGADINVARWVNLRNCGKLDHLARHIARLYTKLAANSTLYRVSCPTVRVIYQDKKCFITFGVTIWPNYGRL